MGAVEDFIAALGSYVKDNVVIEATGIDATTGEVLNYSEANPELVQFRFDIHNNGTIPMANVVVRATGTEYAVLVPPLGITTSAPPGSVQTSIPSIPPKSWYSTSVFTAKTQKLTGGEKPIATGEIVSWNAIFDSSLLLNLRSGGAVPTPVLREIVPG